MNSSSEDDDDDPVVKEIDMYLAKGLAERLFLFQYPVRPASATYDFTPHLGARIKPIQQKVELDLGIDTNSSTYCYGRGEQIAHAVDRDDLHHSAHQKQHFPSNVMDRQCLASVKATEDSTKYAVAIYSNDTIHISPVKGILQLHPSFTYFDKAEENQRKSAAQTMMSSDGHSEEEEEAKLVQLRFSKVSQKKKDQGIKQVPTDERWIESQFYQCKDRRAVMERNLLLCHQDDFESPEFTVTSRDYLQILSPSEQQGSESPADLPHGVLSLLKLKGMNLGDQIKALLMTAKVLQFTQLCALLGGGLDTNTVLSGLTQYAVLVQGCWVVKSEVLYPEGTKSHVSGIDAAKLWPSRDYVMFCFNRKRVLSRKEVASNTRLPTEELREVLEQMGKQRPAQGWEFMLNTDNEFLKAHAEESANQLAMWKQKYNNLMESLHLSEEIPDADWNEKCFPGLFPGHSRKSATSRRRVPSQTISSNSDNEKAKSKARNRTKSQSSQDGSDLDIKPEKTSPIRNIKHGKPGEGRLNTTFKASNLKNPNLSQSKAPKERNNRSNAGLKKNVNAINSRLKAKKTGVDDPVSVDISDGTINVEEKQDKDNCVENMNVEDSDDVKPDIDVLNKRVHFTDNDGAAESVEMVESNGDDDDEVSPKGKKKKPSAIVSDDDDDEEATEEAAEEEAEMSGDIYMEDSSKSVSVVEVDAVNGDGVNSCGSDNAEEIFVPPMVTSGRDTAEDPDRPPSDIFMKELKKFCRETIQSGCLSLMELKEVLHMRQQEPGNILCTGVTDDVLISALNDSGAFEIPIKWSEPNNIPLERKRIFIYRELGEPTDKYRSVVIDMFSKSQSLRRKDIFASFKRTLKEEPSSHMYTKFLAEFCQNHQGQWYLNGTYPTIKKYS